MPLDLNCFSEKNGNICINFICFEILFAGLPHDFEKYDLKISNLYSYDGKTMRIISEKNRLSNLFRKEKCDQITKAELKAEFRETIAKSH